jgi:hypothetical protein
VNTYRTNEFVAAEPAAEVVMSRRTRRDARIISAGLVGGVLIIGLASDGCSATLAQQGLSAADESAQCITTILLDVTGLAPEDPAAIAGTCGAAVIAVYNFVQAEIAFANTPADASISDAGNATSVTLKGVPATGSGKYIAYVTPAQLSRAVRIRDAAGKLLGKNP